MSDLDDLEEVAFMARPADPARQGSRTAKRSHAWKNYLGRMHARQAAPIKREFKATKARKHAPITLAKKAEL